MFGVGRRTNRLRGENATYNTFHGWASSLLLSLLTLTTQPQIFYRHSPLSTDGNGYEYEHGDADGWSPTPEGVSLDRQCEEAWTMDNEHSNIKWGVALFGNGNGNLKRKRV